MSGMGWVGREIGGMVEGAVGGGGGGGGGGTLGMFGRCLLGALFH